MMMKTPKDYLAEMQMDDDILFNRHEVSVWLSDFIKEIQVDSYNQAIENSKKLVNSIALDDASIRHIVNLIEELKIK